MVRYANATRRRGSTSCTASCFLDANHARTRTQSSRIGRTFVPSTRNSHFNSLRIFQTHSLSLSPCVSKQYSLLAHWSLSRHISYTRRSRIHLITRVSMLDLDRGRYLRRAQWLILVVSPISPVIASRKLLADQCSARLIYMSRKRL